MLAVKHRKSQEMSSKISSTQGGGPALVRGTESPFGAAMLRERKTERWRFANSSCPVCTHTHSFVFNDLDCSHLRTKASFAGQSAPNFLGFGTKALAVFLGIHFQLIFKRPTQRLFIAKTRDACNFLKG